LWPMTLYAFTKAKDDKAYSTDDYMTFNIKNATCRLHTGQPQS